MAEVDELIDAEREPGRAAQLAEVALALQQRAAPCVERRWIGAACIEQPRLLEAFTDRRDVVVQPALREPEARAGCGVVERSATRMAAAIAIVNGAAGKDPRAA